MKYAIMSDVHANPQALETALADARALGCEKFLFLGDITGYGYDAKGALDLVRKNFDVVLLGNHDSACLGRENAPEDEENPNYDQDRRQRGMLSAADLKWLGTRRHLRVVDGLALAHGDFMDPRAWNYVFETPEAVLSLSVRKERFLFCGHTHHAEAWELKRNKHVNCPTRARTENPATEAESIAVKISSASRYLVNVGSVGYPRNDLCSTYAICDPLENVLVLRRLPFDFKSYLMNLQTHKIEFPDWLYELLMVARADAFRF